MINLAALFVLSPSRSSSASSRCLQARPNPSVHPAPSTTPPPAFRHPANASLCFAPMFKGLQAGNLLRLSGAKLCRPALLGACWCTAACVPSRGAATAQCSACAAFLVAAAAGAAKRVQEGLSLLLYSFVSSFQVVLCEQRCACGQVANRWVRSLSPDLGGDIDKTRTKRTCATQSALKHLKCATLAGSLPMYV